jgi:hypothetical protein
LARFLKSRKRKRSGKDDEDEADEESRLYAKDKVAFGDVVQAPPTLKRRRTN